MTFSSDALWATVTAPNATLDVGSDAGAAADGFDAAPPAKAAGVAHAAAGAGAPQSWLPAELQRIAAAVAAMHAPANSAGEAAAVPAAPSAAELAAQHGAELEAARQDGFDAGRAAGVEEGRRMEAARLSMAHTLLEEVAAELRIGEARWVAAAQENVTALAIAVAAHIIGREVRGDAAAIAELVRRALADFPLDEPLRVRLSPLDLSTISAAAAANVAIAPGRDIRWIADAGVQSGGCVVEGRERIVDGRVDRALERMYRALADD